MFHDLIEAAVHTGRHAEAAAHAAAARDCRLDRLSPRLRLVFLAAAAITAPQADTADLERAIAEPGNDRWPFDLARIQLTYGAHLRRAKRTGEARRYLADVSQTFHRLGAVPWAERADRELRATGISHSITATGLASLTPQQLRSPSSRRRATPTRRSPPAVPVPADGIHPPLPGVPQARHHLPRSPARCPRGPGRLRVTSNLSPTRRLRQGRGTRHARPLVLQP
ncbi:hypothetical protein [Microtetraspora malaysiensis]